MVMYRDEIEPKVVPVVLPSDPEKWPGISAQPIPEPTGATFPFAPVAPPSGVRYNFGKPGISLMLEARHAVEGCARVMDFGAGKYARSNWRRGLPLCGISDSLARHLVAFLSGEDNDPETGLPHVDHIMCNAFFLSENYHTREDMDDRPFKDGKFVESLTVPKPRSE